MRKRKREREKGEQESKSGEREESTGIWRRENGKEREGIIEGSLITCIYNLNSYLI